MSEIELAWAAGFYDGEGSVSTNTNNGNPYTRVQLSIGQKNDKSGKIAATLIRFQNALKLGKIYRKTRTTKELNQHQFLIVKSKDVKRALALLWKNLSQCKKEQAIKALLLLKRGQEKLEEKRNARI